MSPSTVLRDLAAEEDLLDELARHGHDLHHSARADRRDDARLVPRLHPRERTDEVGRDAEPARPGGEARLHVGRGRRQCRGLRNVEVRPDQENRGRVDLVRTGKALDGRAEPRGERGQRVAGPDDVDRPARSPGRMIPERERGESLRPRDAVCGEPVPALERPDRRDEARAEVAVERTAILAGLQEQELEHRDVEAEITRSDRPRPEARAAERPERVAGAGADPPGRREPGSLLGLHDRGARLRPDDPVDPAAVEPVRAQRDLYARLLRGGDGWAGPDESTGREPKSEDPPRSHGLYEFAQAARNPAPS